MKTTIFDIESWKEIGVTLARNKTRTFLTAFGIFWGTAVLAMLWGGANGFQDMMRRNFDGMSTNSIMLTDRRTAMPYKGYKKGMRWSLDMTDLYNLRRGVSELYIVTPINDKSGVTVVYGRHNTSTTIQGMEPDFQKVFVPVIYDGRFINDADQRDARKVCVVGKQVKEKLFGSESAIGRFVSINNIYYRVIGVCGQTAEMVTMGARLDESVLIPNSTMRNTFHFGDEIDYMMLLVKNGHTAIEIKDKIRHVIRKNHPIHPDDDRAINYFDISEPFSIVNNLFLGIDLLALFVGLGTLLAGIVGVGNIMWIIVKERTQEIGIRRAIGARPKDIIVQILSESVVLTMIAGIAGICFTVVILGAVQTMTTDGLDVPGFQLAFIDAIGILMTFAVLGTIAGTIPAFKAMRIKPIEALNDK